MGQFYVNFTLQHRNATAVAETLRKARRDAFIAADNNGEFVVVVERETSEQDPSAITKFGKLLSKKHSCPTLAMLNHDEDVLRYWLFDKGTLIDAFDSESQVVSEQNFLSASGSRLIIAKFDPSNVVGGNVKDEKGMKELDRWKPRRAKNERGCDVNKLCTAFDVPKATDKAMRVLHKEYTFASDQHRALCKAIGLPALAVGAGFDYLMAEELPRGLRKSQLLRVGRAAPIR